MSSDPWAWWYRLYAIWIAVVHFIVGGMLIFGPARWEQSNSLQAIHDLTHIPWLLWGAVFWLLGVAIATSGTITIPAIRVTFRRLHLSTRRHRVTPRQIGYLTSVGISGVFEGASIIWTVLPGKTTNPVVIFFSTLSVLAMISGARYCEQQEANKTVADIVGYDYRHPER